MKVDEKNVCSFNYWYPIFKQHSFKSICIPVSNEVLEYLKSDVVTIPDEAVLKKPKSENIDDTYSDWSSEDEDEEGITPPTFPDFSNCLQRSMDKLGGSVFVKMNWSAPTDASWIATNSNLCCSNLQDLYLLLKSSDKISKDLSLPIDEYFIVLKKWEEIIDGSEFRCFVVDGHLIAITQRDKFDFHSHISSFKFEIVNEIKNFFNNTLKDNFILRSFVFDVMWQMGNRIKLVDLHPYKLTECECYLFTPDELNNLNYDEDISPEFRYISEETGIQPSLRRFGMPIDLTDAPSGTTRSIIEFLRGQIETDQ